MFVSERTYPASFRGARFFYKISNTAAGRKTAIHEYPQKDFRNVEDLGKKLKSFEITAIIKGTLYFTEKKKLEEAMTTPGIGILVHPFYGNINVHPLDYEVTEEDTSEGQAVFRLRFAEAQKNFSPQITSNAASIVANLYNELYVTANSVINLEYTLNFIRNIEDAAQVTQRIAEQLRALYRIAVSFEDGRTKFRKSIDKFEARQYSTNQNPEKLADDLTNLIGDFDNLSDDSDARFDFNRQAFGLGFEDELDPEITLELTERRKNRRILNGTYNYLILNNLYATATVLTYDNEIQLDNVQDVLESFYESLINNESVLLTNEMLNTLANIRNQAQRFFANVRTSVAKIINIRTDAIPTRVLTYNYYGSSDNYDEILALNDWTNPAIIKGQIRILDQ
jgi:prophage DNA circulation protein